MSRLLLIASMMVWGLQPLHGQSTGKATLEHLISPNTADLGTPSYLQPSPGGDLAVSDDNVIRIFFSDGRSRVIGGQGEGPGEFRHLTRIGWNGDSIWALDPTQRRISLFSSTAGFLRAFTDPSIHEVGSNPRESPASSVFTSLVQAVLPGGDLRVMVAFPPNTSRPTWARDVPPEGSILLRVSPAGAIRKRLAVLPPSHCRLKYVTGRGRGSVALPFCLETLKTDWDGSQGIAIVEFGQQSQGESTYRAIVISERGDTLFSRSFPFRRIQSSKQARDSALSLMDSRLRGLPPEIVQAVTKAISNSYLPPIKRIILGTDNTLWLEEQGTAAHRRWTALGHDGTVIGSVELPAAFTAMAGERGHLWGFEVNADELQGVAWYRVEWNQ